jgi:hypothetical protein
MTNERISVLNEKRKTLHENYRTVAIEWTKYNDFYKQQMSDLGDQIRGIDVEIRRLRTPVEEL